MQNLTQTIRNAISGMFTKNVIDEVMQRIEKAIDRERGDCVDEEGVKSAILLE